VAQLAGMVLLFVVTNWLLFQNSKVLRLLNRAGLFLLLSAVLFAHDSTPFAQAVDGPVTLASIALSLVKAAWWMVGSASLVGLVRIFLIFERKPREARLLQDLVVAVIYVGAVLCVISYVLSVPVGTLVATSGVFAIILGLALQSTLSDVFSGIALNLGRPYSVGDWIVVDEGSEGRVVETNWRATHLVNGTNDLVTIPNSSLAKAKLVNRSSPDVSHGASIKIRLAMMKTPAAAVELMETALQGANSILKLPPPTVKICAVDTQGIELELSFRIASLADEVRASNEVFDLAFRHAKAQGVGLAGPTGSASAATGADGPSDGHHSGTAWRLLNSLPLLATLTEDEKEALSAAMVRRTFRKNDIIARQGDVMGALLILRSGIVSIERDGAELMRLSPGDWLGEGGLLTGTEEIGTITALTPVVAYEIGKDVVAALLRDRPAIADEVSTILSRRLVDEKRRLAPQNASQPATSLAAKIRRFFDLQDPR
jgi:small-conductance mechanosensitive channel